MGVPEKGMGLHSKKGDKDLFKTGRLTKIIPNTVIPPSSGQCEVSQQDDVGTGQIHAVPCQNRSWFLRRGQGGYQTGEGPCRVSIPEGQQGRAEEASPKARFLHLY